ncbi:MAG: hypothetical protein Q4D81_02255 [Eubacteriales bacterium]|nr:hypothetical protein [Eubacteriales bacterium]
MIIATTTEYGTDEDTETCSRITRSVIDNYMHRPSVEDRAIRKISTMAGNDISMIQAGAQNSILFDAAFVMINRNICRFLISGRAACYHFEDGKLAHRSDPSEAPALGSGLRYEPRLEPSFQLNPVKNAFLTASRSLSDRVTDQDIEEALRQSASPEEWMERLQALSGPEKQFCAITAFLPMAKPSLLEGLLRHRKL